MKIKTLKTMLVNGIHTAAGETVEVSEFDGNYLVKRQFAEVSQEKATKKATKAKAK